MAASEMSSFPHSRFSPGQELTQGSETQEPQIPLLQEPQIQPLQEPQMQPLQEPQIQPLQEPQHQQLEEPQHQQLQEPQHQQLQEPQHQQLQGPQHQPQRQPVQDPQQPEQRQLLQQLLGMPLDDLQRLLQQVQQPNLDRIIIDIHHLELQGLPARMFGIGGAMAGACMIYKLASSERFVDAICDSIKAVSGAIVRRITEGSIKLEVLAETKEISNCLVEACKSGKLVKDLNQRISACGSDTNEIVYGFDDIKVIATTSIEINSLDLEKEKIQSGKNIEKFKQELARRFEESQEMKSASLTPGGIQLSDKLKAENQGKESRKSPSGQEIVQQTQQMFKGEALLTTKLKENPKGVFQLVQDYRLYHSVIANEMLKSLGWI